VYINSSTYSHWLFHWNIVCDAGTLKLDISPCPPEVKNCLTPELYRVDPYPDNRIRPIKEIVEFPVRDILEPYTTYRSCTFLLELMIINQNYSVSFQFCNNQYRLVRLSWKQWLMFCADSCFAVFCYQPCTSQPHHCSITTAKSKIVASVFHLHNKFACICWRL